MYKKLLGLALAGTLALSVPLAFAESAQGGDQPASSASEGFHPWKQLLQDKAQWLGIQTSGLSNAQIRDAVKQAEQQKRMERLTKAAEKLGIATEGKTAEELKAEIKAKIEERLQSKAQKLGIDTNGMTDQQIRQAIKQSAEQKKADKLKKLAAKLGIDSSGKTPQKLFSDIEAAMKAKWNKMNGGQ